MEAAIIAALVAGAVSLIGLLVNLRLAREARHTAILQLKFGAALKFAEESVREIKVYSSQIEKLRIYCWRLLRDLEAWESGDPADTPPNLVGRGDEFMNQFHVFFDAWAAVKSDFPGAAVDVLRLLRHDSRHLANDICHEFNRLQSAFANAEYEIAAELRDRVRRDIYKLMHALDQMGLVVMTTRGNVLIDAWTGEKVSSSAAANSERIRSH